MTESWLTPDEMRPGDVLSLVEGLEEPVLALGRPVTSDGREMHGIVVQDGPSDRLVWLLTTNQYRVLRPTNPDLEALLA